MNDDYSNNLNKPSPLPVIDTENTKKHLYIVIGSISLFIVVVLLVVLQINLVKEEDFTGLVEQPVEILSEKDRMAKLLEDKMSEYKTPTEAEINSIGSDLDAKNKKMKPVSTEELERVFMILNQSR